MTDPRAAIEERILGGTTARRGDAVFVRGEGCWLVDSDGRRYLDLSSAQGVAMLGHCHPRVTEAIARQAQHAHALPELSLQRRARRVRRGAGRRAAAASAACLSRQQRRRSRRWRAEVRAPRRPGAPAFVADHEGLSRPHRRRAVGDVGAEVPRGLPAAARRRRTCRSTTSPRSTRRSATPPRR